MIPIWVSWAKLSLLNALADIKRFFIYLNPLKLFLYANYIKISTDAQEEYKSSIVLLHPLGLLLDGIKMIISLLIVSPKV